MRGRGGLPPATRPRLVRKPYIIPKTYFRPISAIAFLIKAGGVALNFSSNAGAWLPDSGANSTRIHFASASSAGSDKVASIALRNAATRAGKLGLAEDHVEHLAVFGLFHPLV